MREYLFQLLETSGGELTVEIIAIRLAMSAVIAAFLFLSYRLSHSGSIYSAKFNVSLAALTVITTTVMIVIGNNIALSPVSDGHQGLPGYRLYLLGHCGGNLLWLRGLSGRVGGKRRGVPGSAFVRPDPQ